MAMLHAIIYIDKIFIYIKNTFLYKNEKKKIHFLGVIINSFLVVKPSSLAERKILFGCSYIASSENGIWKKNSDFYLNN